MTRVEAELLIKELTVKVECVERLMNERERYYLEKINGQIGRIDGVINASDKALKIADASLDHWKTVNNEWRKSLEDARTGNISRLEALSEIKRLGERIDQHEKTLNTMGGRTGGYNNIWLMVKTILGLLFEGLLVIVEIGR